MKKQFWPVALLLLFINGQAFAGRDFAELDIVTEIKSFNSSVMDTSPELFSDKVDAMSGDLFSFLRGTAHIMNKDLQKSEKLASLRSAPTGMVVGDLHMHNFSIIKASDQPPAYAIDDLDEACNMAPLSFDIFRLSISMIVGFDGLQATPEDQAKLVRQVLAGYRARAADAKIYDWPAVSYPAFVQEFIDDESDVKPGKFIKKRTTNVVPNRFDLEKFAPVSSEEAQQVKTALESYLGQNASMTAAAGKVLDIACRTDKGLASIGLKRYFALLSGKNEVCDDDLIVEIKEMRPTSVAESDLEQQRAATIEALRRAHQDFDEFMGTITIASRPFLVRQLYPWSETIEYTSVSDMNDILKLAHTLGFICADFHAAAGQSQQMIAWLDKSEDTIVRLISEYSAQLRADYQSLLEGMKSE